MLFCIVSRSVRVPAITAAFHSHHHADRPAKSPRRAGNVGQLITTSASNHQRMVATIGKPGEIFDP
jgi:hypothetical protein